MSITPFSFFLFYSFLCFFFLFSLSRILYPIGCRGTLLWHLLTARDRDAILCMGYSSAYRNRHHSIPALASCPCPRWPPRPVAFVPAATAPHGPGQQSTASTPARPSASSQASSVDGGGAGGNRRHGRRGRACGRARRPPGGARRRQTRPGSTTRRGSATTRTSSGAAAETGSERRRARSKMNRTSRYI